MNAPAALVSILIPAYNERYFGQALASALAQTYPHFEVVVCDDSPGRAIEEAVERAASPLVRYVRNPANLGFAGNFMRCFTLARGDLIKFLNDDDRLRPRCVETFARVLAGNPGVMLATSRRSVIDAEGRPAADVAATAPVSHVSALVLGRELGDLMLVNSLNLVGEPTTAMFRRAQLRIEDGVLFRWGGVDYHCLADLSLWLRLLAAGLAYYDAEPLSEYRMHLGQEQDKPGMRLNCLHERLAIAREARRAGFLGTESLWRTAMESVLARASMWGDPAGHPPEVRAELEEIIAAARAEAVATVGSAAGAV